MRRQVAALLRYCLSLIAPAAGVIVRVSAAVGASLVAAVYAECAAQPLPTPVVDAASSSLAGSYASVSSAASSASSIDSVAARAHLLGRAARRKLVGASTRVRKSAARLPGAANRIWVVIRPARRLEDQRGAFFVSWPTANRFVSAAAGRGFPFAQEAIFHGFPTVAEAEIYWSEVFGRELARWL
jgi:hypothetical protein